MKKTYSFLLILAVLFSATACNKYKTYSQLQDMEEAEIQNYIKENNWKVVTGEMPKDDEWGENVYYKTDAGIYFRLIEKGDAEGDSVQTNLTVGYRFIEYDLDKKQTVRIKNWEVRDFEEPSTLIFGTSTAYTNYGAGLNEALELMKYKNSEAFVIIPSHLNVDYYSESRIRLIPVYMRLKITVIK